MFLQIFLIGILAGMSPGPDFFVVIKNSLGYGKKIGIASAIGIKLFYYSTSIHDRNTISICNLSLLLCST